MLLRGAQESVWFLAVTEVGLLSCLVEGITKVALPGDALAPDGAADGVIPEQVVPGLAQLGWALCLLPEDGEAEPVLGPKPELTRPQVQAQCLAG